MLLHFDSLIIHRAFRSIQIFLQNELLQLGAIVYFLTHLPLFLVYNMLL